MSSVRETTSSEGPFSFQRDGCCALRTSECWLRRPTVALLITGNELLPCGSRPEGHRIVDSNSVMLDALIRRDGGSPQPAQLIPDRVDVLRSSLLATQADLVLISGGSSVGQEDLAPRVLDELGELCIHGGAIRP